MMKRECAHNLGENSTLRIWYSQHNGMWAAGCSACRRDTGFVLTREEAVARAEKGWWAR